MVSVVSASTLSAARTLLIEDLSGQIRTGLYRHPSLKGLAVEFSTNPSNLGARLLVIKGEIEGRIEALRKASYCWSVADAMDVTRLHFVPIHMPGFVSELETSPSFRAAILKMPETSLRPFLDQLYKHSKEIEFKGFSQSLLSYLFSDVLLASEQRFCWKILTTNSLFKQVTKQAQYLGVYEVYARATRLPESKKKSRIDALVKAVGSELPVFVKKGQELQVQKKQKSISASPLQPPFIAQTQAPQPTSPAPAVIASPQAAPAGQSSQSTLVPSQPLQPLLASILQPKEAAQSDRVDASFIVVNNSMNRIQAESGVFGRLTSALNRLQAFLSSKPAPAPALPSKGANAASPLAQPHGPATPASNISFSFHLPRDS